jgi:RimJ/RimL family protein N-acetyltransferase
VPFDYQPVLKSELVVIRPLRPEDHDDLFAVACDPLIWEQHPVKTRHEESGFRAFFRDALASGGALIVIDAATQRVIGSSRFHGFDEDKSEVEIGWTFLARACWGGVYNGELKRLMIQHALQYAKRIVLVIGRDNLRSQRAAEKIGGLRVGSKPDESGQISYVYRITGSTLEGERTSGNTG